MHGANKTTDLHCPGVLLPFMLPTTADRHAARGMGALHSLGPQEKGSGRGCPGTGLGESLRTWILLNGFSGDA